MLQRLSTVITLSTVARFSAHRQKTGTSSRVGSPPARVTAVQKVGFWYFLICNTFLVSLFEACATRRKGVSALRLDAAVRFCAGPIALLLEPIWVLNCDRERGSKLCASSTSYPFLLPLLRFSPRVCTYKFSSIALSTALSHQNIKGSGAFATYRCSRFL